MRATPSTRYHRGMSDTEHSDDALALSDDAKHDAEGDAPPEAAPGHTWATLPDSTRTLRADDAPAPVAEAPAELAPPHLEVVATAAELRLNEPARDIPALRAIIGAEPAGDHALEQPAAPVVVPITAADIAAVPPAKILAAAIEVSTPAPEACADCAAEIATHGAPLHAHSPR